MFSTVFSYLVYSFQRAFLKFCREDDEVLTLPLELTLVILALWPTSREEDEDSLH